MTMLEHQLLGYIILMILWNFWIKKYFYTQKNLDDIDHEVNEWINK